jgi:Cu+-exporting ATPase
VAGLLLWVGVVALNFFVYGKKAGVSANARGYLAWAVMAVTAAVVGYAMLPVAGVVWRGMRKASVQAEVLPLLAIVGLFAYGTAQCARASNHIYFDSVAGLTALTALGWWIERDARARAGSLFGRLYDSVPAEARAVDPAGHEKFVKQRSLRKDDLFVVKGGERIPADGVVVEGESVAYESIVTGVAAPISKKPGDRVIGGSLNGGGWLKVAATTVGEEGTVARIVEVVESALGKGSGIGRTVGRVTQIAVLVVLVLAVTSGALSGDWLRGVSVLVVGCPWALAIAAPLVMTGALGYAWRHGVLIGDARKLEAMRKLDVLVLGKTGVVTEGRFELEEAPDDDLAMIAAVEQFSDHALGRAVVERFRETGKKPGRASGIEVKEGLGITGLVGVGRLCIGRRLLFDGVKLGAMEEKADGRTRVCYGWDQVLVGQLAFKDRIRYEVRALVYVLNAAGIRTVVVSGDSVAATGWASKESFVEDFRGELLPGGKAEFVTGLQKNGRVVGMIGDGGTDAETIAQADVGIAASGGIELALKAGTMALMTNDLLGVIGLREMSVRAWRLVRRGLAVPALLNVAGLAAAGWGWLNPIAAGCVMVASIVWVSVNARGANRLE